VTRGARCFGEQSRKVYTPTMAFPNKLPPPATSDDEISAAWASEVSRRLQEVQAGTVELVNVSEVKRRIQEDRAARQQLKR
jgi:hypothetical protein